MPYNVLLAFEKLLPVILKYALLRSIKYRNIFLTFYLRLVINWNFNPIKK